MEHNCGFRDSEGQTGCFHLTRYGPTLQVDLGYDAAYDATKLGVPNLPLKGVQALVDTGAGESFIDVAVAEQLGLPKVDRSKVSGSAGEHEVDVYMAHIHCPALAFTIHGRFGGVRLSEGGQIHRALIGRTFLQYFEMHYNGPTGSVLLKKVG